MGVDLHMHIIDSKGNFLAKDLFEGDRDYDWFDALQGSEAVDSFRRLPFSSGIPEELKDKIFYDAERDDFVETRILYDFKTKFPFFCKQYKGFAEELYNADELTWQTVKLKHRIGLMNLLDWNQMLRGADEYIPTIIENETLDTDEWIELAETVKDLDVEDEVLNDSFYNYYYLSQSLSFSRCPYS